MIDLIPRRSVLYMPGANARALEKARTLPADAIIIDLEDAVAPQEKVAARTQAIAAVNAGGYGFREIAVRINGLSTEWGASDLAAVINSSAQAIAVPKVESVEQVVQIAEQIPATTPMAIWAMIETPRGVMNVEQIVQAHPRLNVIVMGTSDLAKDLRVPHTPYREGLAYSLGRCVVAARSQGLTIIDGVHLDLEDDKGFSIACEQGRNMGFDGKSLIHPKQVAMANRIYSPTKSAHEHAQQVIEAWKKAQRENSGVVVVNGKLVENLHVEEARRTIALMQAIEKRSA